ncbi:hypothetical protein NM75643_0187 [Neisseria meningitidis 75643]|nr:hypothetical protein NM75643_0187 [Neisseria meningitidis 75643]
MPSETACRVSDGIPRSVLFFPVKHHRLHRRARQAFGQCQHRHQPHGKRIFQHRLPTQPAQGGTAKQQLENPRECRRIIFLYASFVRPADTTTFKNANTPNTNQTVPSQPPRQPIPPSDTDTSSPARPNASAKASCTANANGSVKNTSPANRAA